MSLLKTFNTIVNHPLNRTCKIRAISSFIRWQLGTRLLTGAVAVPFVNGSRLLTSRGMHGATGNIYTGLFEFEDMSFLLHFLRRNDLFVDVGANVGAYTVLAGSVVGSRCIAVEPIPGTFQHLVDNVNLNRIYETTECLNIGIGRTAGTLRFTSKLDSENHVVSESSAQTGIIEVSVQTLDDVVADRRPMLIKIDVEGFETEVVAGAERILSQESLLAVIMELNGSGARYGFDEALLHKRILDHGFKPFSYSPFSRDLLALNNKNVEAGNTIYVRNVADVAERLQTAQPFVVCGREI